MHTTPDALLSISGVTTDRRPNIVDVAPTILERLGVPVPAHLDGSSLLAEPSRV
jgi:arylsulfatase A-like enzyme